MKRQLTITTEPIDEGTLLAQRSISSRIGAAVYFLGIVRGNEVLAKKAVRRVEVCHAGTAQLRRQTLL